MELLDQKISIFENTNFYINLPFVLKTKITLKLKHLLILSEFGDFPYIPCKRILEKQDIENLSSDYINKLIIYVEKYFETNIKCFIIIDTIIKYIFSKLNNNDVLLSPGDSPSKIIIPFIINYKIDKDIYMVNGTKKRLKIIQFPISGRSLHLNEDKILIDNYIHKILKNNNVLPHDNIKIIDYFDTGDSYNKIRFSISRYKNYNNIKPLEIDDIDEMFYMNDIILPFININPDIYVNKFHPEFIVSTRSKYGFPHISKECLSFIDSIVESENSNSRCIPYYNLKEIGNIGCDSLFNCNAMIAVICLKNSQI